MKLKKPKQLALVSRAFVFGSAWLSASPLVHAANIWDGGAGSSDTLAATNWDNNLTPTTGTLTFAGSVQTIIAWNGIDSVSPVNITGITFASGASAFTINTGTQTNVQFVNGGTPLLNSSSNLQTLNILSSVFFNGIKTFDGGASGAGFALNGGISLRGDSLTNGQTNTLNLIGTADSTAAFINEAGTYDANEFNAVTKNGSGKWTVTGNASYSGATTITQGTMEFQGSVASSSITNSAALIFNNAGTQSYANNISGGGTLAKQGAGTFTISGNKTYTGATTITGGTLSVASIANGGSASGIGQSTAAASNLVFDGGTLQYTGATSTSNRAFTINSGKTATIEVTTGASNLSVLGATGSAADGALTKTGTGTLTLSGANTYTGATTVSVGTLKMGYSGSTAVTLTNASFETDGGSTNGFTYGAITGWTGGSGNERGTSATFSGVSGVSGLPNYNASTNFKWAFQQLNAVAGSSTALSQTVTVTTDGFYNVGFAASGRGGANGPLNIQVLVDGVNQTNGTTITPTQGAWNTYTSNGVFLAAGSHTLAFSFINALGGDKSSTLDQVSLTGATQGSLAAATTLSIASGATFDINGTQQTVASLSDSGGGGGSVINSNSVLSSVLTVGSASGTTTFSGAIGGGGGTLGFTKSGNSTQILSGTNTYTGATTVSGGTLAINGTITSAVTVQTGATLQGSGGITGNVTIQGNGTLATGNSIQSLSITGDLAHDAASIFAYEANNNAAADVAGDLTTVSGNLTLTSGALLTLSELGGGSWLVDEKLTLISYAGTWNNGLFTYESIARADDSTFTFSGATWRLNYNDTIPGTNYATELVGTKFVTMTVIPEPRVALLGCLGFLLILRRRR